MTRDLLLLIVALFSFPPVAISTPLPPGAVQDIEHNDPEVQACASFALESFNTFSKETHLFIISNIYSIKKTNIGGGLYNITLEIRKSQCKKFSEENKECHTLVSPEDKAYLCQFVVLSAPWKKQRFLMQSSCTPSDSSKHSTQ